MKLNQLFEANIAAKIKDPKVIKQIFIAMRHDGTLPKAAVAKLGTQPTEQQTLELWSQLLDKSLSNTRYGNISQDGKFDDWITRLYINGQADYEDINGEGGDALGAWKALSIRGRLDAKHQDVNKFKSIKQVQKIINSSAYRDELRRIADAEVIEKHKREKKEIPIVNNKRFFVVVPMNYGACYTFNHAHGYSANFCTGSSSGLSWFRNYAPDGPIVSIVDKEHEGEADGKWQFHAPTSQLVNADQERRHDRAWNDEKFSKLFPGLMKEIVKGMEAHAEEIKSNSTEIINGGYDVPKAVEDIKKKYPLSYASEPESAGEEEADGAGTWLVTHTASNRTARIPAENKQDAIDKLLARHPNVNLDDFTFKLEQDTP